MRQIRIRCAVLLFVLVVASLVRAEEARTSLMLAGGGLLPTNSAVFDRLIEAAKVGGRTRIGIFPTASATDEAARRFARRLVDRGVPSEQIQLIDVIGANAIHQAENPAVVEQIRNCTALVFTGGDQKRITRALLTTDGVATAALQAIRALLQRGGVLVGSSAGAAALGDAMISVSGLPVDSLDEGMDALDFGLIKTGEQPARRGLLVSRGLGVFRGGLIDQHFSQYRGRLARLARAVIEEQIRFGFGIDENTVVAVSTDGSIEVLGAGHVTIIDSTGASCQDGPLGCSIAGVRLTCLQHGDRFDPKTGLTTVHPGKQLIEAGKEEHIGNFPIPDIAGEGAVLHALFAGLGNNSSRKQIGITLKHNQYYGHGYRFTFMKSDQTRSFEGDVDGIRSDAVTNVLLTIEPVALTLRPPESALPADLRDLPQGPIRRALEAISFRGIMLADKQDRFRPDDPVTRAELASAIAQTIHLQPERGNVPAIEDVSSSSPEAEGIALVVSAGLMTTDGGLFRPADPIARQEAAAILVRLAERYSSAKLPVTPREFDDRAAISPQQLSSVFAAHRANLLKQDGKGIRPAAKLTRQEAAEALYRIVGFPW